MGAYFNGRYEAERAHSAAGSTENFECTDCLEAVGEYDYCEGDGGGEPLCQDCRHELQDVSLCHKCYEKVLARLEANRGPRPSRFRLQADEDALLKDLLYGGHLGMVA